MSDIIQTTSDLFSILANSLFHKKFASGKSIRMMIFIYSFAPYNIAYFHIQTKVVRFLIRQPLFVCGNTQTYAFDT